MVQSWVTRFNQGRYEESLQAYDNVIQIDQQNAVAWNNRGIVLGVLGKSDAALQSFVKAASINSSFAEGGLTWESLTISLVSTITPSIAYTNATEINPMKGSDE